MSRGFLLDTHSFLWWMFEAELLSHDATELMVDKSIHVFVSAVSAMEISTKYRKGKLPQGAHLVGRFDEIVKEEGFMPLPINLAHADLAGSYDSLHKDPWDRLLAAQTHVEQLALVTSDPEMKSFGITTCW